MDFEELDLEADAATVGSGFFGAGNDGVFVGGVFIRATTLTRSWATAFCDLREAAGGLRLAIIGFTRPWRAAELVRFSFFITLGFRSLVERLA